MASWSKFALEMRAAVKAGPLKRLSNCCKKIINSLPGKWGQRMKTWVDFASCDQPEEPHALREDWFQEWGKHPVSGEITAYRTIAGQTQYQDNEELTATSCPSVAAFWTAYGRVCLLGLIYEAGSDHVYYYDTDSLIVDQAGYDALALAGCLSETSPGGLKLKEQADNGEILGIRRYRIGERWCVSGPFGGENSLTGPQLEWEESEGFAGQLWHRNVGDPVRRTVKAGWRGKYHHGVVGPDGRVSPFRVGPP
jgi:hypothetical protein